MPQGVLPLRLFVFAAAEDAAIGQHRGYVKRTRATGEPTSMDFQVKVVAPWFASHG